MAPLIHRLFPRELDPGVSADEFKNQWKNAHDVFTVLLILGGDVVGRALGQLSGSRVTPVAFSFGWVSYAVMAVVSTFGENKVMPPPDCACKVINGENGYIRENASWIIGRIMRDYESWMDPAIKVKLDQIINAADAKQNEDNAGPRKPKPPKAGLCVSVYNADTANPGHPGYNFLYWTGIVTVIVQLGIAAIPCGLYGDWSFFLITICGNLLAFATGMMTQWGKEKWACREHTKKNFILTKGNGSQHAIIIKGNGRGLDLEDLSTGGTDFHYAASWWTKFGIGGLGVLWILLLITAAGIERRTWFLLGIGALGIVQNMLAAGLPRNPRDFGVPLTFERVIGSHKVMDTLFDVEEAYPHLGRSMRNTFFPGRLSRLEDTKWNLLETRAIALDKAVKDREKANETKDKTDIANAEASEQAAVAAHEAAKAAPARE